MFNMNIDFNKFAKWSFIILTAILVLAFILKIRTLFIVFELLGVIAVIILGVLCVRDLLKDPIITDRDNNKNNKKKK